MLLSLYFMKKTLTVIEHLHCYVIFYFKGVICAFLANIGTAAWNPPEPRLPDWEEISTTSSCHGKRWVLHCKYYEQTCIMSFNYEENLKCLCISQALLNLACLGENWCLNWGIWGGGAAVQNIKTLPVGCHFTFKIRIFWLGHCYQWYICWN